MTMNLTNKPLPDQETLDRLLSRTKARLFSMKGASWLGTLLCSHNLIWDYDCPTAWCNGETIGFSPQFFVNLGPDQRVTLLAHELFHTMLDHCGNPKDSRMGDKDPEIWNYAADYVINNDLDRMGYVFTDMAPLLDHQYDGMTTEQVYDLLVQNHVQPAKMMALICPEEGQTSDKQDPGQGNGPSTPSSNGVPIPGLCGDLRIGTGPGREKIIAKIVAATQAAHMAKDAGSLPGESKLIVDDFLEPVLPWNVLLQRYFTEMSQDDYSWKQPSRRYQVDYLPTLQDDNGLTHLVYYLDVSGSITDGQIKRFLSEVRHIHEQLKPRRLTVVTFDTIIQDTFEFVEGQPFQDIEIIGRGGTDLSPVYHHIKKHVPTAAVIFSDLYVHPMAMNPGSPVLWVIMANKKAVTHFGTRIHLTKEQIG